MNEEPFGQYLKKIRLAHNVSQRELANNIGVDFTYLSKIENGKLEPPAEDTIKKIADFLGENADNLILLANKIPSDYKEVLKSDPKIPFMLRQIGGFTNTQRRKLFEAIEDIERNK
jgi:transcriptional regulator with XRE-family HTH domain